MQQNAVSFILFSIGYAIAGIVCIVRMWGLIIAMKQENLGRDALAKQERDNLQRQIDDLHQSDRSGQADLTGLSTQIAQLGTTMGKIEGQLAMLIMRERGGG